jgi:hypothetical protein
MRATANFVSSDTSLRQTGDVPLERLYAERRWRNLRPAFSSFEHAPTLRDLRERASARWDQWVQWDENFKKSDFFIPND